MRFGVHTSIAGGLPRAAERAAALGCDCVQLFVANPRGWAERPLPDEEAERFRTAREAAGLDPVVVHLSYLPNLATPYSADWSKSVAACVRQYRDAARIGADFFVLHPGSSKGGSHARAVKRVAKAVSKVLRTVRAGPVLLLENTSGAGSQLGASPEQLGEIDALVGRPARVGVCFDTAHAHAAGTDLTPPGAMRTVRERYRRAFGRYPIRLLHLNDLRTACGAGRDRHDHLGKGSIGADALSRILHTPGVRSIPCVLETPVDEAGDDAANLARARALAE